jgi:hypothetical protein
VKLVKKQLSNNFSGGITLEGLMWICRNWGDSDCHPDVAVHKHPRELKEGDDTAVYPIDEELRRIDEICRQCEARFFEIERRVCPGCGGSNFSPVQGFIIQDNKDKEKFENYYLKCRQCETPSVLKKFF